MKLLFLGDVMGRAGRRAVADHLPRLREEWRLDFVVVNGENASNGAGLTGGHATELLDAGADCLTLGDHAFDQREMLQFIETEPRIIRPINFAKSAPGAGHRLFTTRTGKKAYPLGGQANAVLVDMHCEATSEKMAMGHYCDGRASVVVGTHTHVPTADAQILPGGTAFQSDAGMCGDYNSVIGMDKEEPMRRFLTGMAKGRFMPALGEATLSGLYVETDDRTGKAERIAMVRVGGRLEPAAP
jgi:calcineurin-like phosphoesterase